MKKRKVFILLTRLPGTVSGAIHLCTGFYYTHASIGFEEDMNTFYSFVIKGFIVEKISRYVRPDREPFPCQLYELDVSVTIYENMKETVQNFMQKKDSLHYTRLGVILSLLHIPCRWENHYFCSQFVAEILRCSHAACLEKDSALFLPKDIKNVKGLRKAFQGNLKSMMMQYSIA